MRFKRFSSISDYIVHPEELYEHLMEIYNFEDTIKFKLEDLNKREYKSLAQEDKYQNLRKEKLSFFDFKNCQNYTLTDFVLNDFKVQEKIAKKDNSYYICNLHKSNGRDNKIAYNENDNDFYWIHLDDWETFYVIPQNVLIDHGHITTSTQIGNKRLTIYPKKYNDKNINGWLEDYMFEYDNLDITKLKSMFQVE